MSQELCAPFRDAMAACREEVNARFAIMSREFPSLDGEAYFTFLRTSGNGIAEAAAKVAPDLVGETGRAICEVGLELVARHLAGPRARHRWIDEAWQRLLPQAARVVAQNPRHVLGALSNAVHQLSTTYRARPTQWLALMEEAAALTTDATDFLRAGQVAAWRSGLAHYREPALALAEQLPAPLLLAAMGEAGDAAGLLERLRRDPWFDPARPDKQPHLVARAGGFRGFGGPFPTPPVVTLLHGQWVASSAGDHWLVAADAFGATFHRVVGQSLPPPLPLDRKKKPKVKLPADCGEMTSFVQQGATTAVTASLTHAVLFFHTAE